MRNDVYVYNHATETVEKSDFDSKDTAKDWADKQALSDHLEVVDARPL